MKHLILVVWAVVVVACGATAVDDDQQPPVVEEGGGPITEFRVPESGIPAEPPSFGLLRAELAEAQRRWASVDRPWYRYDIRTSCECHPIDIGPSRVVVIGTDVTEVWYEGPFEVERPHALELSRGFSAEALFARIERAIADGTPSDVAYYDNGMPRKVYLDLDGIAADGGFAITINRFQDPVDDLSELADARVAWNGSGITDYTYRYRGGPIHAGQDIRITVVAGAVESVSGQAIRPALTIPEFFDELEILLRTQLDGWSATYSDEFGYPIRVTWDYDRHGVDDEGIEEIPEFTPNR